jgi:rfaE bifunctional protein kinase chain/domain
MVDAYLRGTVDRISPEAPVPVVALQKRENRPGGAANVALNIQSLGAKPLLVTVIGNDSQGEIFTELMADLGMQTDGILQSPERLTTTKFRVIGNNVQMLRVDEESLHDLSDIEKTQLLNKIKELVSTEKPDSIILQDYDKGVLTPSVISEIVTLANQMHIPVCVDPKRKHFSLYKNVQLFKPNLKELKEGLKTDLNAVDKQKLESASRQFQKEQNIDMLMVTLSEHGVMISSSSESKPASFIPAHRRSITDVSGAGDTVISVAALCLALKFSPEDIAAISNLAGGLVCEQTGVVPVEKERLNLELNRVYSH